MDISITGVRKRHVAVFSFPFSSHPSMILTLVRRLASADPTVVFSFFGTKKVNRTLFTGRSYENIVPYDVSDGIQEEYVRTGKPHEEVGLFLAGAEEEFKRGVEAAEKDFGLRISCLVVDAFLIWFAGDLAERLSIPWVVHWIGGASSLSAHFYTDLIREKYAQLKGSVGPDDEIANLIPGLSTVRLGSVGPDDEIANLIPGLSTVRLGDLPRGVLFGNLESPFETMLHKMAKTLPRATAVTLNSFQELDPKLNENLSSVLKNFLNVGPFNKKSPSILDDQFSCIPWLDNQKPGSVAYISFGSLFTPPPNEMVALAEALEETRTPFLWSTNKESQKHLPTGFLERATANGSGKVVSWAPQAQVLEHIATGVFITHGGWNSAMESIVAGVAMICRPLIGDNLINIWMFERVWQIGVRIEGGEFTKHGTCSALKKVFSTDGSREGRKERIQALKVLAHNAVGPHGSSTKNFNTLAAVVNGATL